MSFASFFINRPVLATALNLVLLVVGWVAFEKLELRHMPTEPKHEVEITTCYPGSQNFTVEQRITKPLEDTLTALDGIRRITSESLDGHSRISVKFQSGVNYDTALSQVRDRVYGKVNQLPENAKRPEIVERSEVSAPIMYISFEDSSRSRAALSDYLRRYVEDPLRLLEGVAEVERWGDKLYQVSILLDPIRLMEKQITVPQVINALRREKSFASGGEIERSMGKQTVVIAQGITKPEEFRDIPLHITSDQKIRLSDVADVQVTQKDTALVFSVDGQEKIGLQITAKPQANPLDVVSRVTTYVEKLQKALPPSIKTEVTFDVTLPFKAAMKELRSTLLESIFLVAIIVTLSLASFRAAIIPMLTVPLCLIGTFAIMWLCHFSMNPITLLALVLAVGLVVDDAIVVVENIYHHMEQGLSAFQAAVKGMKEITFSIIVMTITLAAVYMPLAFHNDDAAVVLREFAWTLAGSVLISGAVALTLAPALCGRFLSSEKDSRLTQILTRVWERLHQKYRYSLDFILGHPKWALTATAIIISLGILGYQALPSEWMPVEDEDYIQGYISADNRVPDAVRQDWTKKVEEILLKVPEKKYVTLWEWQKQWLGWTIVLKPRKERTQDSKAIVKALQPKLDSIVGPKVGVDMGANSKLDNDDALKVVIQYQGDYGPLLETAKAIIKDSKKNPIFQRLSSEETWEVPKFTIKIDRLLAAELGVQTEAIEDTLYTFLSGRKINDFHFKGLDYDVELKAAPAFRSNVEGINQFFVKGADAQWIPLGSLIEIHEALAPQKVKHYNRMRAVSISAVLSSGVSLEQGMKALKPLIEKHLPDNAQYHFGGKAEKYLEAKRTQWVMFGLSLVFIYLVLSGLFESFLQPFVVLLTVPLSVAGAVAGLYMIQGSNNVYTTLGLVTLIGLITKHGILIVDFTRRLLEQKSMSVREAVLAAATRRLRPVLMTTLAMIFGAFPLLTSIGSGAIARHHLGCIIVGGMISGTVFSLYIIPLVYALVVGRRRTRSDAAEISAKFKPATA